MNQDSENQNFQTPSTIRIWLVASIHLGVSIAIVFISSFVNSEMKFLEWNVSLIPFVLGIPVVFELTRLLAGFLYDRLQLYLSQLIIGTIISTIGLYTIHISILHVDSIVILGSVSSFYFGSAILTTLADTNLTSNAPTYGRGKIAGAIQISRLLGFAIGGILGSILYTRLPFTQVVHVISVIYIIFTLLLIVFSLPNKFEMNNKDKQVHNIGTILKSKVPLSMSIFMVIYPLGLFMQDLILEPFAIDHFGFLQEDVGRVVVIWTTLTLIFVPLGVYMENKGYSKTAILFGTGLSITGLLGFTLSALTPNLLIFYLSLIFFGIGNGFGSAPSISLMLGVSRSYPRVVGILLAYYGILNTIGRLMANVLTGLILLFSSYSLVFFIELIFALLALFPILFVHKNIQQESLVVNDVKDTVMYLALD